MEQTPISRPGALRNNVKGSKQRKSCRSKDHASATANQELSLDENAMRAPVAERYVLRQNCTGSYLSLNHQTQSIEGVSSVEAAWSFHSHEGAVSHALLIGQTHGETPDVIKLA